jgi:hypothetical protein
MTFQSRGLVYTSIDAPRMTVGLGGARLRRISFLLDVHATVFLAQISVILVLAKDYRRKVYKEKIYICLARQLCGPLRHQE